MKKALQYLSAADLEAAKQFSSEDIVEFVEGFRELQASVGVITKQPSILISMKVPKDLLENFKVKAKKNEIAYQTQIKQLMLKWLREGWLISLKFLPNHRFR